MTTIHLVETFDSSSLLPMTNLKSFSINFYLGHMQILPSLPSSLLLLHQFILFFALIFILFLDTAVECVEYLCQPIYVPNLHIHLCKLI